MKKSMILLALAVCILSSLSVHARKADSTTLKLPYKRFYVANGLDAGIFSTATVKYTSPITNNSTTNTSRLRYTYFFNMGTTFNFNLSRHFGIVTGLDIKNIGYIQRNGDSTTKRRVYTLGVPVGIKIGNMAQRGVYMLLGGGVDMPFNYKEKNYVTRRNKVKFNEWFSERTPMLMPYMFAGVKFRKSLQLKLQYYPGNFLNTDYSENGVKTYTGNEVNLILFSAGYNVPHKKKSKGGPDVKKPFRINTI